MATTTPNTGLTKPAYTDQRDVGVINANMDIIDDKLGALNAYVATHQGSGGGSLTDPSFRLEIHYNPFTGWPLRASVSPGVGQFCKWVSYLVADVALPVAGNGYAEPGDSCERWLTGGPIAPPLGSDILSVTVGGGGTKSAVAGTAITPFTVSAVDLTDSSRNSFKWAAFGKPPGIVFSPADSATAVTTGYVVSGTPTASGVYNTNFEAIEATTGSAGYSNDMTWTVTDPLANTNAITVNNPGDLTFTTGQSVSLVMTSADTGAAQGQTHTWTATGQPAWLVFNAATQTFSGTAPATAQAAKAITVTATSGTPNEIDTPATFNLTVVVQGALRFAGDPGDRYYFGANVNEDACEAWIQGTAPAIKISMERTGYGLKYASGGNLAIHASFPIGIWSRGRIVQWSCSEGTVGSGFEYEDFALAGTGDRSARSIACNNAIDSDIRWCQANTGPAKILWWTSQHEPDCSSPMPLTRLTAFRDANYYIMSRMKAANLQYVAFAEIYYCGGMWGSSQDYRLYCCEWNGTGWRAPIFDMWGTDWYNPYFGTVTRRSFDRVLSDLDHDIVANGPARDRVAATKRPLLVGEMGIKSHDSVTDPKTPGSPSVLLNEVFKDLDTYSGTGRAGTAFYPGRKVIAYDLWNASGTFPPGNPKGDVNTDILNPNGWPDSGYNATDDPDGYELVITGSITGGTFNLTYLGVVSGAIQWPPTKASIKAALEGMNNIAVGAVYVNGTYNRALVNGADLPLTIHWAIGTGTGFHYGTNLSLTLNSSVTGGGTLTGRHSNKRGAIANQCTRTTGKANLRNFGDTTGPYS